MSGYMGKILRVNLTTGELSTMDTAKYAEWGGGNGMGTAICWDLIDDWTIDGFDPKNVISIMTSPLSGTLAPSVSGRTEMVGIGVQGYPIGWFTRSNFGGRFAGQLKYAGWDGIVLEGAASSPVWIDIRNDDVQIKLPYLGQINREALALQLGDDVEVTRTMVTFPYDKESALWRERLLILLDALATGIAPTVHENDEVTN